MAKILIAASSEPRMILERILKGHELLHACSINEAVRVLEEHADIDQIICTILFDESRMFDLLRLVRSRQKWNQIPFVCAQTRAQTLNVPIALEGVEVASKALGAAGFISASNYTDELDMRKAIEALMHHNGNGSNKS